MKIGDISNPIKRQDSILFLKLNDKRISKVDDIDIEKLKNRIINQKKMNFLIYIQEVIYLNLKIQVLLILNEKKNNHYEW